MVEALPGRRALVTLTFFGPGLAGPHQLARKILKQEKNWRLNGELVYNPEDAPGRYDELGPGDFALMEFSGTGAPGAVKVVLISAANIEDTALHAALSARFPIQSMAVFGDSDLEQITSDTNPVPSHPIWDWLDKDLIEEVGQGSAIAQLNRRRRGRGISLSELQSSKAGAERVGLLGEELLDHFFQNQEESGVSVDEWVSQVNAISPFDFHLEVTGETERYADAKSTAGPFKNPIHLSVAEILFASQTGVPYDLYRLYEVREGYAKCRVAKDIGAKLVEVLDMLRILPDGVEVDSFSFNPDFFSFDPGVVEIVILDEMGN